MKNVEDKLKILLLEEIPDDVTLIWTTLKRNNLDFTGLAVKTKDQFINALENFSPDIILADHSLSSFNSYDALDILKKKKKRLPFILVSGNITEELADDIIKRGADDYIVKDRPQRLPNAIRNSLEKFRFRRERQSLMDEIIKNERHYRALIENIHDAIILIDKKGRVIYQSPSTANINGFNFKDTRHKQIIDYIHPDDQSICRADFKKVYREPGISITSQYRVRHKNDHYIWVEGNITNLLHDESVHAFIINYRDISERKKAEQQLAESEKFNKEVLSSLTTHIAVIDRNGDIVSVNKAWEDFAAANGQTVMERSIKGSNYFTVCKRAIEAGDDIAGQVLAGIHSVFENGNKLIEIEYPCHSPKEERWFILRIMRFGNDGSKVVTSHQDITKRKKAQKALQQSEANLQAIFKNTSEGFVLTDLKGDIKLFNNRAEQIFLANSGKFLQAGESIFDFVRESTKPVYQAVLPKVLAGEDVQYDIPFEQINGDIKWYVFTITRVVGNNGDVEGFSLTGKDITERKEMEELLRRSESNLHAIIENTDAFIYSLDKELRYVTFNNALYHRIKNLFGVEIYPGYDILEFVKRFEPDSLQQWMEYYAKALGGEAVKFEKKFVSDGPAAYTCFSIHPMWEDNKVIGLSCFVDDITKQKLADEEHRRQELRYRQIVETAQEGIWLIDENNVTTFVNKKMCEILDYTEEEMIGRQNFDFMDEPGKKASLVSLEKRKKGVKDSRDMQFITKSGKYIWASVSANPLFDENKNYVGALGMLSDITDKKNLETLLDKTNELARIGGWEIDVTSDKLFLSAITKQIFEVLPDFEPTLESAIDFIKSTGRDAAFKAIKGAIKNGVSFDIELQLITAAQNELWVRAIGEAEIVNNKCVRVYGSFQDIDKIKRAELAVLAAYEERNIILESIGAAFFAVDKDWKINYWNHQAEKSTSTSRIDIIGKSLWNAFPSLIGTEVDIKYHKAAAEGVAAHFDFYFELLEAWFEISAYPSENGMSIYFRNIMERKINEARLSELHNNLEQYAKELAVSNAELEQFAYVASHDLQEPLRMVTSFLSQIEKRYTPLLDEKGKQYIHFAMDGAKRMRKIILDLLEFSKVGRSDDKQEEVNLDELVNEILGLLRKQIKEKEAVITVGKLPVLKTFISPIRQVFQNLISNSLIYHKEGQPLTIEINAEDTGDFWQFVIKDNGIGIDPAYFEKIFILFQRLHQPDEFAGTGIGLAITKKIIDAAGGRIWVASEEGKGSTFYFTLPK